MSDLDLTEIRTKLALISQRLGQIEKDVEKINNANSWIMRLVVGAVILALLGTVVTK